jgi:flagellar basal-body rod protein FlgB
MANMIQKLVFDKVGTPRLQHMVDLAAFRHKLLASNVANATSPGYQRRDIDFQQELSQALATHTVRPKTTRPGHIISERSAGAPDVVRDAGTENSSELSAVDIDMEMAQLATNTLNYEVGMKLLSKSLSGLRTAIRGGQ